MAINRKIVVLGAGIALGLSTIAQAAQQPQYQGQIPQMGQGMGQTGAMMNNPQMLAQMSQMMSNPQMQAQMSQMSQICGRMMSNMGNRMPQPGANRR